MLFFIFLAVLYLIANAVEIFQSLKRSFVLSSVHCINLLFFLLNEKQFFV